MFSYKLSIFWNGITKQPALFFLLLLFSLSIFRLNNYVWTLNDNSQGPVVLLIVIYLFFIKAKSISIVDIKKNRNELNIVLWFIFLIGVLIFIIGRSQYINFLELLAYLLLVPTLIGMIYGTKVLNKFWFPIFFMIFLIPLPSFLVASITMPIKIAVSAVTVDLLSYFDFPIARSGVVLQVGQYQLLVADACSGMNTLLTLEGMGLLYLNLVRHASFMRNMLIALLIFPISFFANVIRVIAICLITYYFGNEIGQGFLHGFAGILLFLVALLSIITIDGLIQKFLQK